MEKRGPTHSTHSPKNIGDRGKIQKRNQKTQDVKLILFRTTLSTDVSKVKGDHRNKNARENSNKNNK